MWPAGLRFLEKFRRAVEEQHQHRHRSIKTSSRGSPGCWSSNRSSKSNCNQTPRRKRRGEGSVRGIDAGLDGVEKAVKSSPLTTRRRPCPGSRRSWTSPERMGDPWPVRPRGSAGVREERDVAKNADGGAGAARGQSAKAKQRAGWMEFGMRINW